MTTPIITKHLVKLPAAGKGVLLWIAIDGQQVGTGEAIARFDAGTVAHNVNAPGTGRLSRTTPDNTTLIGGSVVGWVSEGEQGTLPPQKPSNAPKTVAPFVEGKKATSTIAPPQIRQQVPPPAPKTDPRARRNAHVEPSSVEASITILENGEAGGKAKKQGKKHRTKHTVYHVTEDQEARVKALSFLFKSDSDEPNYSESEIMRAAIEHLLSQDKATQKAILSYNRDREKRAGYGAGWKRPGKR